MPEQPSSSSQGKALEQAPASRLQQRLPGATVFIDRGALQHNAKIACALAPDSKLLAVIKADGYGHGATVAAQALTDIADGFAVARIEEGIALREAGVTLPLVALSPVWNEHSARLCREHRITPTLFAASRLAEQLDQCIAQALPYWLKFDSGFHRLGLRDPAGMAPGAIGSGLCETLMTHFHSAEQQQDNGIYLQMNRFCQQLIALQPRADTRLSVANSAAILRGQHQQLLAGMPTGFNAKAWIRPGIMLYGANPLEPAVRDDRTRLRPAMHFAAPVIDIRQIRSGDAVGYNQRWRASRPSTIATIAAGYADGYPRHAISGTPVAIRGQVGKLVGTVSMDTLCVDITDIASGHAIAVGDTAELWGAQVPAEAVARSASTIPYTLFTGIGRRVSRQLL